MKIAKKYFLRKREEKPETEKLKENKSKSFVPEIIISESFK